MEPTTANDQPRVHQRYVSRERPGCTTKTKNKKEWREGLQVRQFFIFNFSTSEASTVSTRRTRVGGALAAPVRQLLATCNKEWREELEVL